MAQVIADVFQFEDKPVFAAIEPTIGIMLMEANL
jgi:hypothetical protein